MIETIPHPQVAVLDTGGQYCHLIARKVRELGVYADVVASETPAAQLKDRLGLIISGGPSSVYEPGSPTIDPQVLAGRSAVLGVCYGQQVISQLLGGKVRKGERGEYGLATLTVNGSSPLFRMADGPQQIWMSHRDTVQEVPLGFAVLGRTATCEIAAIADEDRRFYGVQFHPEVVHTENGQQILRNFLFDICGCVRDWDPRNRVPLVEHHIREVVGDRNVFFFVSGGVDSTVAFTLCLKALGEDRVSGFYVETGLMREGETAAVREMFRVLGSRNFSIEDATDQFLSALSGSIDPELKRHIIGREFVAVQERILRTGHFLEGNWILGQGTIYPDTIESGGSAKADLIKTHHNRVAGIQKLLEEKRIVEPLSFFYKDEVREIGKELGLPEAFLSRHPFPGPGLAIRCLCAESFAEPTETPDGWILPIRSVGVQGDARSYRSVLAIPPATASANRQALATDLVNRLSDINRVIGEVALKSPIAEMRVRPADLSLKRLDLLRKADATVRRISEQTGFENSVWQFPVVLIPFGTEASPDSVVLRPVDSMDGMTAASVDIPASILSQISAEILALPGVAGVFHDLTHKPPGTIEWE